MRHLSTTMLLLEKVHSGDQNAVEQLIRMYYPIVLKWAKGRMPYYHRDLVDTSDIVHEALISAIRKLDGFKAKRAGAFFAYIRTIILNRIRREISQSKVRPHAIAEELRHSQMLQSDHINRLVQYDQAIDKLDEKKREAVIMRFEFGLSFEELALLIDKPSADAARMYIRRSLIELTEHMS